MSRQPRTNRKPVAVTGKKETRLGILSTKLTNRKRNPVTVEIAFTSSLETKKLESYFSIEGRTTEECVLGLCDQFQLAII